MPLLSTFKFHTNYIQLFQIMTGLQSSGPSSPIRENNWVRVRSEAFLLIPQGVGSSIPGQYSIVVQNIFPVFGNN